MGAPEQQHEDDRLNPDELFDAGQWALHGLLEVYYDREAGTHDDRIEALLEQVRRERDGATGVRGASVPLPHRGRRFDLSGFIQAGRRRWAISGSLAAAIVVIAVGILTLRSGERAALAAVHAVAQHETLAGWRTESGGTLAPDADEALRAQALAGIEEARRDLENAKVLAWQGPADFSNKGIQAVFMAYLRVFRPLCDLGEFDAALEAVTEALDFARGANPAQKQNDEWLAVYLNDLGNVHLAMGEFEKARQAFAASIEARQRHIATSVENTVQGSSEEYRPALVLQSEAGTLAPLYWKMSYLPILEDDLGAARTWQAQAESALRQYFAGICAAAAESEGANPQVEPGSLGGLDGLLTAYSAAPRDFQRPPPIDSEETLHYQKTYRGFVPNASVVSKLREHLYREARLRRVEGDFEGARQVLRHAASVPYFPVHDESRLDFFEPLESARISILLGDYPSALDDCNAAERNAGVVPLTGADGRDTSKPAIALLPMAELKLLRAVALLGSGAEKAAAQEAIRDAMAVRDAFAARLDGPARTNFSRQFETWDELAKAAR